MSTTPSTPQAPPGCRSEPQRLRKARQPRLNRLRRPLHRIRKRLAAQQLLIHADRRCCSNQPLTARRRPRAQELTDQSLSQPFAQPGSRGLAGRGLARGLGIKSREQAPHLYVYIKDGSRLTGPLSGSDASNCWVARMLRHTAAAHGGAVLCAGNLKISAVQGCRKTQTVAPAGPDQPQSERSLWDPISFELMIHESRRELTSKDEALDCFS